MTEPNAKIDAIKARWAHLERDESPWNHKALASAPRDVKTLLAEVERLRGQNAAMKAAGDALAEQLRAKSAEAFEAKASSIADGLRGYVTARASDVFAVYPTIDDRGQRGGLVGVYAREARAEEAAKGIGYYGGNGEVKRRKALVGDDGQVWLLDDRDPVNVLNAEPPP